MRLIDVDAVREEIDRTRPGRNYEDAWALTVLDTAPTIDAVPVVRCRKCRHNGQPPDKGFAQCELDALIREPEFWCRAGQREDGTDA